ncbi:FATTY ACID EXPORT 1 protein [Nymphaea thermarum]|nr:FATTY ACID EXPORT 1 protein [Nymphaea thermarum]
MASIGSVTAKAQFSRERSTIYSFSTCNYSGLLASKKRLSLCPSRMDRSFVFSAISIRQQSQRSFAQPSFLTKECHRRTNVVNQDSIDNQSSHMEEPKIIEESGKKNDTVPADDLSQGKKRSAKIHDFCFGIPFGGVVLGAGVVGFLLSGNRATLLNGLLFGGALLALSSYSLKVWRQGKSCLPFILGQSEAYLDMVFILEWCSFGGGSFGKAISDICFDKEPFPNRTLYYHKVIHGNYFYFSIFQFFVMEHPNFTLKCSAGMLCFYLYVLLSGGNPPPKKLKVATSMSS